MIKFYKVLMTPNLEYIASLKKSIKTDTDKLKNIQESKNGQETRNHHEGLKNYDKNGSRRD